MRPEGPAPMMSLQSEYECRGGRTVVTYTSVWDSEARLSSMVARILRMYSDDSQIILARRAYYGEFN